jgi:hypothetical protein
LYGQLFMVGLFSGYNRGVRGQHKVNSWVRHKVSLEFSDIDIKSTVESQGCG